MVQNKISSAEQPSGSELAGSDAVPAREQTYFEALVAALSQSEPDASAPPSEPPLFTESSYWQPWRGDDVFLARPPHALPRQPTPITPPQSTPPDDIAAAAAMISPASEVSNFRRLLAPAAILSVLALAAITHGAVANRAIGIRADTKPAETSQKPPFSLSGQWRRIAMDTRPNEPRVAALSLQPVALADTMPPAATEAQPAELPHVPIAIDAICALPIITASIAPPAQVRSIAAAAEPMPRPVPEPHYSRLIGMPSSEVAAGESTPEVRKPYLPVKLIVAKVGAVEAVRTGATNAADGPVDQAPDLAPIVHKAAALTAAKPMAAEPPAAKKKPKPSPVRDTGQSQVQSSPPPAPRAPDNIMRDSP